LAGTKTKKSLLLHIRIGSFWPIPAGLAQLPIIFNRDTYRAELISKIYVLGMIIIEILLIVTVCCDDFYFHNRLFSSRLSFFSSNY
jgi:hypothetical protein